MSSTLELLKMLTLQAGPLEMGYEKGFLKYLSSGKYEILRMIYFALRDGSWVTMPMKISNEIIRTSDESFEITYNAAHIDEAGADIILWSASISGDSTGKITFEIKGDVKKDFLKNRAGFCVLHPIHESAGQTAEITHPDETVTTAPFPVYVDPENPFMDIRSMRWNSVAGSFRLDVEGDVFETEDQRNWSDASYKTFCTPLARPFPAWIKVGEVIHQKITFSIDELSIAEKNTENIRITAGAARHFLPAIGVAASDHDSEKRSVVDQVKAAELDHYRIEVNFESQEWKEKFLEAGRRATIYELSIELLLHIKDYEEEVATLCQLIIKDGIKISHVIILSVGELVTSDRNHHVESLRKSLPGARVGVGTNYSFTELNRNRRNFEGADFITLGIHPQEHATDDKTLVENLASQSDIINSARQIYPGMDVQISPVTLRRRFNPDPVTAKGKVSSQAERADDRQQAPYAAAWLLGSVKSITQAGASAVTYFEMTGILGIMSEDGKAYPVLDALKKITSKKGCALIRSSSSHPLVADAMLFDDGSALLWNYTAYDQHVDYLDTSVALRPYEVRMISF